METDARDAAELAERYASDNVTVIRGDAADEVDDDAVQGAGTR